MFNQFNTKYLVNEYLLYKKQTPWLRMLSTYRNIRNQWPRSKRRILKQFIREVLTCDVQRKAARSMADKRDAAYKMAILLDTIRRNLPSTTTMEDFLCILERLKIKTRQLKNYLSAVDLSNWLHDDHQTLYALGPSLMGEIAGFARIGRNGKFSKRAYLACYRSYLTFGPRGVRDYKKACMEASGSRCQRRKVILGWEAILMSQYGLDRIKGFDLPDGYQV